MSIQNKIKVGAVSYLNTKPLIYGFEKGMMKDEVELVYDYPSRIASMLLKNEIDAGLVPVAIIPSLPEYHIITDYCIGAEGPVASVGLFSEIPLFETTQLLLDYQSRTSVALAKILVEEYWKLSLSYIPAGEDFRSLIKGETAGLVIGDRALEQRKQSVFFYDLGAAWKEHTGLPFVFAAWVSNKQLDMTFIRHFSDVNRWGIEHIPEVVRQNPFPFFDLNEYYTRFISYQFTADKHRGMNRFLSALEQFRPAVV